MIIECVDSNGGRLLISFLSRSNHSFVSYSFHTIHHYFNNWLSIAPNFWTILIIKANGA